MNCPHCNRDIDSRQSFCQYCGGKIDQQASEAPSSAARASTPWENRRALGFVRGLVATVKESLFSPATFFRNMPVKGGLADPLLYALIVSMTATTVSFIWELLLRGTMESFLPAEMRGAAAYEPFAGLGIAALAVLLPIFLIIVLFLEAGVYHLLLLLVRGGKAGFEGTFRAVAYGNSGSVFMMLPFCGAFLGVIWSLVITIIGLKETHETSGGKASFAVLMPIVLCCGGVALLMLLGVLASLGRMAAP